MHLVGSIHNIHNMTFQCFEVQQKLWKQKGMVYTDTWSILIVICELQTLDDASFSIPSTSQFAFYILKCFILKCWYIQVKIHLKFYFGHVFRTFNHVLNTAWNVEWLYWIVTLLLVEEYFYCSILEWYLYRTFPVLD